MSDVDVRRLGQADTHLAAATFALMAEVFEEGSADLPDAHVRAVLDDRRVIALAATRDGAPVGGLVAHVLPMTRSASPEVFVYDLAVRTDAQRSGVGRALIAHVLDLARGLGATCAFVPADDEDGHALSFYRAIGGDPAPVTMFTFDL